MSDMKAVPEDICQCLEAETYPEQIKLYDSSWVDAGDKCDPFPGDTKMQDIPSVGRGGRLFCGGDRRLMQHHHGHHQTYQPVKCPRCDSINTKFCYYNNYNLSQPRHFCKNCRRYWTKGGVLRNVPVGGGCRKTKRLKQKISSEAKAATKDNSHSSSESSSLTATAITTAAAEVSAPSSGSKLFVATGSSIENQTSDCGFFSEIGNFRNIIKSTNGPMTLGFGNLPDVGSFPASQFPLPDNPFPPQKLDEEMRMDETEMSSGLLDLTAQVDLSSSSQNRSTSVGFGALDWHQSGDQGLLDFPGVVDQAYWMQHQWPDGDNRSLFLP